MKLAVSFFTAEFTKLREFWKKNLTISGDGTRGSKIIKDFSQEGMLSIYDFDTQQEIDYAVLKTPGGFDCDAQYFYVATNGNNITIIDKINLKTIGQITNTLFNQLHSVHLTDGGLLVASSGIDALMEVDESGELLYYWNALDYGYDTLPDGDKRVFVKDEDHRTKSYPTLQQATHLNSAIYSGDAAYISLFHQGEILKIDRGTGEIESKLKGLSNPHSIYDLGRELMFCNTANQSVVFADKDLNVTRKLRIDSEWIQDAILSTRGTIIVADSNEHRIIELDQNGKLISQLDYSSERRIYQIKELSD